MSPKLNARRAQFVLTKIDEILTWEKRKETEKDRRFVDAGRYLCQVRAGQYWRLENLKSFDEFLERRFPESRRTAYYLMSIHEHLPPQARREMREVGWAKGLELAKLARLHGQQFESAMVAQGPQDAHWGVQAGGRKELAGRTSLPKSSTPSSTKARSLSLAGLDHGHRVLTRSAQFILSNLRWAQGFCDHARL